MSATTTTWLVQPGGIRRQEDGLCLQRIPTAASERGPVWMVQPTLGGAWLLVNCAPTAEAWEATKAADTRWPVTDERRQAWLEYRIAAARERLRAAEQVVSQASERLDAARADEARERAALRALEGGGA